jgi:diguanylate cyclase (GGDEF)-like protein/PAS domain S-box-containing protein
MKRYGIERQTLFVTLLPILVMAILLESYFLLTRFADLDRSLLERAQLLTRQLASSCEYALFSGNSIILKQNVDSALSFPDVKLVTVYDTQARTLLNSGNAKFQTGESDADALLPVYQDDNVLRVSQAIMATQVNLDGLDPAFKDSNKLGAVRIVFSKLRTNNQKKEFLLFSLLFTLLVITIALILALRSARRITDPIMQMHHAVRRIGKGDLEINLSSRSNIHELHELSNGISEMAQHLLHDRDMLEDRIVETTVGLRAKNKEVEEANLEKERLNKELALTLGELRAIMESNPDLLYVFNKKGEFTQWNSNFAKFCGIPPEKILGKQWTDFICPDEKEEISKRLQALYTRGSIALEIQLVRHDGVKVPYLCNGVILKNMAGEISGFTGTARDISDRKQAADQMYHMAHYDMLTDLPNRAMLSDRLHQAIISGKRERNKLALMFLDLDMFKYINDNLGHDIGDLLLKDAARRIKECLRESDTAARIGGDEFVVLLPTIETEQDVWLVAEKIREGLSQSVEIAGHNLKISTSIGIALYPEHGSDEKTLLKNADTAMYLAKKQGRNTIVFFAT